MSDPQALAARAHEIFSMNGGSWRDYALIADIDPPRIVRAFPSIGLLDIADEPLAQACRQYLVEQGAQTFADFEAFKSKFGMHHIREGGMIAYESTAGFYTVEHPADWRVSRDGDDGNIANIRPPEGSGEVTISAFHGGGASPMALSGLFDRVFKSFDVVSSKRPISQNNWEGLQAEYLQPVDGRFRSWLVIGALYRKTMVLITANDWKESMPSLRQTYESILYSMVLADPEESR